MQYQPQKDNSSARNITRILLMLLFLSFTVCYIHYMQCDFIALTQHILSGGHTQYNRTIGTFSIAIVASAIQVIISRTFTLPTAVYAVSYIPSALLLAAITDLIPNFAPLKLAIYTSILIICASLYIYWNSAVQKKQRTVYVTNTLITNIAIITLTMLIAGIAGNTERLPHYELKAERYIAKNNFDKALAVGLKSSETSKILTDLRAYALARKGILNEKIFEYPIPNMHSFLPMLSDSSKMIYNPRNIYLWLGAPAQIHYTQEQFLKTYSSQPELADTHPQIMEYWLATLLLNKQIDSFAAKIRELKGDSVTRKDLPKHFREALVLYQRLRTKPVVVIKDDLTETNYGDFTKMKNTIQQSHKNANALRLQYGDTYWWYYYFVKNHGKQ